jgi:hypothetical protein
MVKRRSAIMAGMQRDQIPGAGRSAGVSPGSQGDVGPRRGRYGRVFVVALAVVVAAAAVIALTVDQGARRLPAIGLHRPA